MSQTTQGRARDDAEDDVPPVPTPRVPRVRQDDIPELPDDELPELSRDEVPQPPEPHLPPAEQQPEEPHDGA